MKEKELDPLKKGEITPSDVRSLRKSIENNSTHAPVITELKRVSPSRGEIRSSFQVAELSREMVRGGATGISVLTEPKYFDGRPEFLKEVRRTVDVPVLRKDFIVDLYQIYQSVRLGADAVLLIAEVLGNALPEFVDTARRLELESLVEIRNENQVKLARSAEPDMIGINNRNLRTMEVDISRTERLLKYLPDNCVSISESGIETRNDVERALEAGADAVLVGTALMESNDVESKVRDLVSGGT